VISSRVLLRVPVGSSRYPAGVARGP